MRDPQLIGIDWGTTNLRAWLIGPCGIILDRRSDPRGAACLSPDLYAGVLTEIAGDWMQTGLPVLICGMAGSRNGWHEAPYAVYPTSLERIASQLVRAVAEAEIWIVPGVASSPGGSLGDVMRGEETQVVGTSPCVHPTTVIAPGTHSKWIRLQDGRIEGFQTYLTGELFQALSGSLLLGIGLSGGHKDEAAFLKGVTRSLREPGLSATLFSVRVEQLAGRLETESAADYLSGLLIGAEIALAFASPATSAVPILVIGQPQLAARYMTALELAGFQGVDQIDAETVTALGLSRLWSARP